MICQRSTGPGLPSCARPERRRLDAGHPARDGRVGVAECVTFEGRLGDGAVADARAMHECLVGQVHQVVDNQSVVALHVSGLAVSSPGRIVGPMQVRHLAGSASAGSPGQIQTKRCFSATGRLRTQADGLIVSCDGMKVQRPSDCCRLGRDIRTQRCRHRSRPFDKGTSRCQQASSSATAFPAAVRYMTMCLLTDGARKKSAFYLMVPRGCVPGIKRERLVARERRKARHCRFSLTIRFVYTFRERYDAVR